MNADNEESVGDKKGVYDNMILLETVNYLECSTAGPSHALHWNYNVDMSFSWWRSYCGGRY